MDISMFMHKRHCNGKLSGEQPSDVEFELEKVPSVFRISEAAPRRSGHQARMSSFGPSTAK